MNTRQSSIAVVRRLFKVGRQLVERRLKTLRRLFHPLPAEVWSMLKNLKYLNCFSSHTLVRRLLRLGPGSLERRLKTLRR